jgi:hypothetical protein
MNRPILFCVLFAAATVALGAQEASQSNPYQGTSNPPPDDQIVATTAQQAKPPAGHPIAPSATVPATGTDDGVVQAAPPSSEQPGQPGLAQRAYAADPDGDIVHPRAPRPGELEEGTTIRVKLLDRLSTATTEKGEAFSSRVASDVLQGGTVLIPAGAEIDGHVVEVSSGHPGGHGTMRLRPETVILPNGTRYRLHAQTTATPGSKTRVGSEGTINAGSRLKRDSIEYGGVVGAGAATGAVLGGPVGALTGSLVGAGAVTAHLLINHPQATLEPGTTLVFSLTEPLDMVPAAGSAN